VVAVKGTTVNDREARRTVGHVAELVGVSVRTLHHYDQIGLVPPSARSNAGYRMYSDHDISRLHRVLVYRELGFPLEEIATLLDDPSVDAMAHLKRQRALLDERIDRLHQMVAAVERVMEAQTMGIQLSTQEQSEIFGDNWLGEEYAAEAEQRWGTTDAWKQSQSRTATLSEDDWQHVKAETDALEAAFAQAMVAGAPVDSARAGELAERHRASIARFYDCSHSTHRNLAEMYVADERYRQHYEDAAPGLAQYTRDVIVANADAQG